MFCTGYFGEVGGRDSMSGLNGSLGKAPLQAGQLESLPSHHTMRILVGVVIEVIEDFLSFSVYFSSPAEC